MKNVFLLSALLMFFLFAGFTLSRKNQRANPAFNLIFTNVKNANAKIHLGFYKKGEDFPVEGKAGIIRVFAPGKTGTVTITWNDIPPGEYAIALYQDINGDGKLNKNFIGYPKEPFGFSRNFKPKLSAPKFEDCNFLLDEAHSTQTINLL